MFIDAFVSSVGPVYAGYMAKSLPKWAASLDSITIVTSPGDPVIEVARQFVNVRVVETDLFKQHGAAFNKGAALNLAYAHMDPKDVVLHFDADIEPPDGWRHRAEKEFIVGNIAGALRHDEEGKPIQDLGSWPYGYFQMWKANDISAMYWPLLEVWHPSAGGYDLEFLERWPQKRWQKLSFDVKHYGEVRRNWFGVGLPEKEQAEAFRRMDEVHRVGLRETRIRTRNERNRLKVPAFALSLQVHVNKLEPHENLFNLVRACMTDDPFLATISIVPSRREVVTKIPLSRRPQAIQLSADHRGIRERVVKLYRERHKRDPLICPTGFDR